ncbi:MAG: NAD-dependent epimerase/dehydratase family protein [Chloroflexia bacterium]|nr:NAD-dependent epimerase/dehydratase family protein [Chloroflexia bacterium]
MAQKPVIGIRGVNGFIGKHLWQYFEGNGYKVITISREDCKDNNWLRLMISRCDVVINLAGFGIFHIWTKKNQQK